MKNYFQQSKKILDLVNKKKLLIVLVCFLSLSFLDILGLGLFGSVLSIILSPEFLEKFKNNLLIYINLENLTQREIILSISVVLFIIYLIKTIFSVFIKKYIINFLSEEQLKIRKNILNVFLISEYEDFIEKNNSYYTNLLVNVVKNYSNILNVLLQTLNDLILFSIIILSILIINHEIIIFTLFIFFLYSVIFRYFYSKKLLSEGRKLNESYTKLFTVTSEIYSGFKDINIFKLKNFFSERFNNSIQKLFDTERLNLFISSLPKIYLEFIIVFVVLFVLNFLNFSENVNNNTLVNFAFLAVAILRTVPLLIQFSRFDVSLQYNSNSIDLLSNFFYQFNQKPKEYFKNNLNEKKIVFKNLELKDVSFKYKNSQNFVLNKINFSLNRLDKIGIVGSSGSGKTTFVNILMGLLQPTRGDVLINSQKNIQKNDINSLFTYIPQKPFIFEDTLKNNIEFNFNNSENLDNVKKISKLDKLNLDKFLEKDGLNLSGGQIQRVALARSLYFYRDIYIFDEFTSALDRETEKDILDEVNNILKEKTFIIISHNTNVLKKLCKRVYKIENSEIIEVKI